MKSITCPTCRFVTWATDEKCKRCGTLFYTSDAATSRLHTANPHSSNDGPANAGRESHGRYQPANSSPRKGLAIASMVLGILAMPPMSLIVLGILVGLLIAFFGTGGGIVGGVLFLVFLTSGLITGIVSTVRANRQPKEYGGKGFAIAGMVLSAFSLVTIPVIAAIAIPNLLAARRSANESSAISTMRKLKELQSQYMAVNSGRCSEIDMLTWEKAPQKSMNVKAGYQFVLTKVPSGGCEIHAMPTVSKGVTSTGNRSFFMASNEAWTIRAEAKNGLAATSQSAAIDYDQTAKHGY